MPTGYTAAIKDGISFEQFVMGCSRAMGALIMMRDEPANAPIPERFEPSDYYSKKLAEVRAELLRLDGLSAAEAEAEAIAEYNAECEARVEIIRKAGDLRAKYTAMRERVEAWAPPTTDHVGLKKFMLEQLASSVDFDCATSYLSPIKQLTGAEWRAAKQIKATKDLAYYIKAEREELERTAARNDWLRALRASLASTVPA